MRNRIAVIILVLALSFCAIGATSRVHAVSNLTFSDVDWNHWALTYIEKAYKEGVIAGTSYNPATGIRTFSPEASITHAQFTAILAGTLDKDNFSALMKDEGLTWIEAAYKWAARIGLVDEGSIPEDGFLQPINRYEMTRYIMEALVGIGDPYISRFLPDYVEPALESYKDSGAIPSEYRRYVAFATSHNIVKGFNDETFRGDELMTRAQTATVWHNVYYYFTRKKMQGDEKIVYSPLSPLPKGLELKLNPAYLSQIDSSSVDGQTYYFEVTLEKGETILVDETPFYLPYRDHSVVLQYTNDGFAWDNGSTIRGIRPGEEMRVSTLSIQSASSNEWIRIARAVLLIHVVAEQ